MKKLLLLLMAVFAISFNGYAQSLSWSKICAGAMYASWYGSDTARTVADNVIYAQKANGGWDKNIEFYYRDSSGEYHHISSGDLADVKNSPEHGEMSCLDNTATTQEMRFLAKVYQKTSEEKYKTSFLSGLNMIFKAQKGCGGWSQYYPLRGTYSYSDYITFNDDLMINVLKLLRDVHNDAGDFKGLCDSETLAKCQTAFDKGIDVILKCQYDDNGTKAAWCAQHDTTDFLPTEGRPHELPSISGAESASLLSFLMTIDKPSQELQEAITAAVTWLDAHKYKENAAIEDYTNAAGKADRRIVEKSGSNLWARFIQLGGDNGKKVYDKLFSKLNEQNKKHSYTQNGVEYTVTEYETATTSYDSSKAYQPIYSIYDDTNYPHLRYRFLYNYEDADSVKLSSGLIVPTSLCDVRRAAYQFLGSWCQSVIESEYPKWKAKMDAINAAGDATAYTLDQTTYTEETSGNVYNFNNGFKISNAKSKGYATGAKGSNTIKYSKGVDYTITIPEGMSIIKATFSGYDNYAETDAYINKFNGTTYSSTDYVFTQKDAQGNTKDCTNTIDISSSPATGSVIFNLGGQQCCLTITLYGVTTSGLERVVTLDAANGKVYSIDGKLVKTNASAADFNNLPSGNYIWNGKKVRK